MTEATEEGLALGRAKASKRVWSSEAPAPPANELKAARRERRLDVRDAGAREAATLFGQALELRRKIERDLSGAIALRNASERSRLEARLRATDAEVAALEAKQRRAR